MLKMMESYLLIIATGCVRPLGIISGEIRDFQISTSSRNMWMASRLYANGGWCAEETDTRKFIQVPFH